MSFPQLSSIANDFITIASDVVATNAMERSSANLGTEWLLIAIGSALVLSAKAVLLVKTTRALSSNANK